MILIQFLSFNFLAGAMMLVNAGSALADDGVLEAPSFHGQAIFAMTIAEDHRLGIVAPVANQQLIERANLVCQMAGYLAVSDEYGTDHAAIQTAIVTRSAPSLFDPLSISTSMKSKTFLSLAPEIVLKPDATPEFKALNNIDPCAIATACRGLETQTVLLASLDSEYAQQCTSWLKSDHEPWFGGIKSARIFTKIACDTGSRSVVPDFKSQLEAFHRATKGALRLDAHMIDLKSITDLVRADCDSPLSRGTLLPPAFGTCDYNPAEVVKLKTPCNGSDRCNDLLTYVDDTNRVRTLAPSAPACARRIAQDYARDLGNPGLTGFDSNAFVSFEGGQVVAAAGKTILHFCVESVSVPEVRATGRDYECSFSVSANDMLSQHTSATNRINLGGIPGGMEAARKACDSRIACWRSSELSCADVNFCRKPGETSDNELRFNLNR